MSEIRGEALGSVCSLSVDLSFPAREFCWQEDSHRAGRNVAGSEARGESLDEELRESLEEELSVEDTGWEPERL